jgi:hypothetical protein
MSSTATVGQQLFHQAQRGLSVSCFADDSQGALLFDHFAQPAAKDRVIVGD